ncbi:MAG: hypothetical protein Q4F63_06125, partial [Clostridia bacterium]|nr:hypothetical protein [Clostridia bacterium]
RCEKILEMAQFPIELVINYNTDQFDSFISIKKEKCKEI